jgi:hypothetical protein
MGGSAETACLPAAEADATAIVRMTAAAAASARFFTELVLSKNSCRPQSECRGRAAYSKKFRRGKNKFDVKRAHARRNRDVTAP